MDKRVREQLRAIEAAGFRVKRVKRQGNDHLRAYVDTPIGERFILMATSPGTSESGVWIVRDKLRHLKREIERAGVAA